MNNMNKELNDQWNSRYASAEYIYGEEPNQFFRAEIDNLNPGTILLPGEGEGRNGVYAALKGWKVTAFDISEEGAKKARALAARNGVAIDYSITTFSDIEFDRGSFDCIAMIYVHMHFASRSEYTGKLISYLKPGGTLILEAFSKSQIGNDSGGPKDVKMLFSANELRDDFAHLDIIQLSEIKTELSEGSFHLGSADVVRLVARKPHTPT